MSLFKLLIAVIDTSGTSALQSKLEQIAIERSARKSWSWFSSIGTLAATVHQQHQGIISISASAATMLQQHQRICSNSTLAGRVHQQYQHFSSISYMHWKGYLPVYINQFRSYLPESDHPTQCGRRKEWFRLFSTIYYAQRDLWKNNKTIPSL